MTKPGNVYLVGAGCGQADLITVRGLGLLRRCDAVIYDDLIAPELLDAAPETAERIYMGKRLGRHSAPQSEINAAIIAKAMEGKTVVRLKGGDPFVFGRGGEEMEALRLAGVPCEEVPGISSAIAIPAAAGIPVTHRGLSRGFHVMTAHTASGGDGLPEDLERAAGLSGTLVLLMGLARLEAIAAGLMAGGRSGDTPAAVVSGGNSPNPAAVRGTLGDIAEKCRLAGVSSPAVIVVGDVAALELSATTAKPLQGVSVALTGTDAISGKLGLMLTELGARVFAAQRSVVEELETGFDPRTLCRGGHTVAFTSSNGVRIFFKRLAESGIDLRRLSGCRFAVIGASTGATLGSYGIQADLCPETYTSRGLAAAIGAAVPAGERIVLFRSAMGSRELAEELGKKYDVTDVAAYDLRSDRETEERAAPLLRGVDFLCFSSAGGVEMFLRAHRAVPEGASCVCIGEVTARALAEAYHEPFTVSRDISARGMAQAILDIVARGPA